MTASCGTGGTSCVAFGSNMVNAEDQALATSGNVIAKNVKLFGSDARLASNVTDADPAALLAQIETLRVVERAPSENLCKHQGRARCTGDRTVGFLAQQVGAVLPAAIGSGVSLTLVDATKENPAAIEQLDALQGLDVAALLAVQTGAIQALSARLEAQAAEIAALRTELRRRE